MVTTPVSESSDLSIISLFSLETQSTTVSTHFRTTTVPASQGKKECVCHCNPTVHSSRVLNSGVSPRKVSPPWRMMYADCYFF